jgi:hypothetical protein
LFLSLVTPNFLQLCRFALVQFDPLCKRTMLWRSPSPVRRPPGFIEPRLPTLADAVLKRHLPIMVFVTKCRVVTFASFIVLGTWTLPASSEPNETNVPRPCSASPRFCELITREAERTGLDPALVDAVIKVESDYRPDTIGAAGEIGLMQVRPSTARLLGFGGTDRELAEPATNIRLGVTYLAKAWNLAQGDLCRALMKYRAGHGEEQMTPLSVEYCRLAREHLAQVPWVAALAAVKECKAKRLSGELKTYVQSAMCSNPGIVQAFAAINYKRLDLIQGFAAKRRELAEKLDRGQITEAQGERELSDFSNRIRGEERDQANGTGKQWR